MKKVLDIKARGNNQNYQNIKFVSCYLVLLSRFLTKTAKISRYSQCLHSFFLLNFRTQFFHFLEVLVLANETTMWSPFDELSQSTVVYSDLIFITKKLEIRGSVSRLPKSNFHPIGFYGLDCLNDISDDKPSDQSYDIRGTFYKEWASLPIYPSNDHLTDLTENSDPLSIKTAPIGTRKLIGLLYSDALHNKLCCTTKCFCQPKSTERTPSPPTCTCKLCSDNVSTLHPITCTAFPQPPPPPVEKIKTLWFNSHNPILMM